MSHPDTLSGKGTKDPDSYRDTKDHKGLARGFPFRG